MFRVTTEIIESKYQSEMPNVGGTYSKEKTENMFHDSWSAIVKEVLSPYPKLRGHDRGHRSLPKTEMQPPGSRSYRDKQAHERPSLPLR